MAEQAPAEQGEAAAAGLDGYAVENQVGFLLRRAHQRHVSLFLEGMNGADLTPRQFSALFKTVELGHVTQNLLGRLTAMDPATIQGVVRRLMARGLVRRAADPMDRRSAVLAPTEAGAALARQAAARARRVTEATLAPLDPDERERLLALLRRIA